MAGGRISFDSTPLFQRKIRILSTVFYVCLGLLFFRLFYLQILRGVWYGERARQNQEQRIVVPADRGEIFDRTYDPSSKTNARLAVNINSMDIFLIPGSLSPMQIRQTASNLALIVGRPPEEFFSRLTNVILGRRFVRYEPVLMLAGVNDRTLRRIAENNFILPGIHWQNDPYRVYPHGSVGAHLMGYVGMISREELESHRGDPLYHPQSVVGKMGIEREFDRDLRGEDGEIIRIVDAQNRIKNTFPSRDPRPGRKIVLNIDLRLQEIAETVLENETGACIISRPGTGEILAMASSPGFDPNDFIKGMPEEKYRAMADSGAFPFLNRAISAKYPPSSTFKIITQTAALEEEVVRPQDRFFCEGHYELGEDDHIFRCWNIHGWCDAEKALAVSCDVYYYNVGYLLGSEKISRYSRLFGLGEITGIDLPSESPGFIPTHAWKRRIFRESWYDGDTINMSIGQGFLLVTPIQMLNVVNAIANEGVVYKPFVVSRVLSSVNDRVEKVFLPRIHRNIPLSRKNLDLIRRGMAKVTSGGTGAAVARYGRVQFLGKTGTAQLYKGTPHAWFVGYTPAGRYPDQYSIVVFVEHGGGGGDTAVPIALAALQAALLKEDAAQLKRYFFAKLGEARYDRQRKKLEKEGTGESAPSRFQDVRF